jgi:hypothetical protein
VTARARQARPTVLSNHLGPENVRLFVAVITCNRDMASRQTKRSLAVSAQGECGRHKLIHVVATFATIQIWGRGELTGMLIDVAVGAITKLDVVNGCFTLWNVAFGTGYGGVPPFQRVSRSHMFFQSERGGFESGD